MAKKIISYLFITLLLLLIGFTPAALWFRQVFIKATEPMGYLVFKAENAIYKEASFWVNLRSLANKNWELSNKVNELLSNNAASNEIKRENELLKNQLGIKDQEESKLNYLLCDIVGLTYVDEGNYLLVLNKGALSGIRKGSPVVVGNALVGIIENVTQTTSDLKVVGYPEFKIFVYSESSNISGIAKGSFGTDLVLERTLPEDNILVGENIFTSGKDGNIPKNLLVGTVKEVKFETSDIEKEVFLKSAVNFKSLEKVFVIVQ